MKLLIINGSHRAGNTDIVVDKVTHKLLSGDHETRVINLRDIRMELPDGCEVCADSGICPNIKDQFALEIDIMVPYFKTRI